MVGVRYTTTYMLPTFLLAGGNYNAHPFPNNVIVTSHSRYIFSLPNGDLFVAIVLRSSLAKPACYILRIYYMFMFLSYITFLF